MTNTPSFDAIVLAGGASKRMGRDKALIPVGGEALLRRVYGAVSAADRVVAVAPATVARAAFPEGTPDNLVQTLEQPRFGGPVAGIVAGLDCLREEACPRVAILACDLPHAPEIVEALFARLPDLDEHADALCAVDDGWVQWLAGIYSLEFLLRRRAEVGDGRGLAVRDFIEGARLVGEPVSGRLAVDVDTPEDLRAITENLEERT